MRKLEGAKYFLGITIMFMIGSILFGYLPLEPQYKIVAIQVLFILIPSIWIMYRKGNIKDRLSLRLIKIEDVFIVLGVGILCYIAVACINMVSMRIFHNFIGEALSSFKDMGLMGWILVVAVTPAICEEVLMRGLILSEYRSVSIFKAALINGLFFGLLHFNINQFLYAFFLGVVMSYMVVITKSILSSMILHFSINSVGAFAAWFISAFEVDMGAQREVLKESGSLIKPIIILMILITLIVLILKAWAKKNGIILNSETREENNNRVFDVWVILNIIIFIAWNINIFLSTGRI